jgi:hypothetical protein
VSDILGMSVPDLLAVHHFEAEDLPMGPNQRFTVFKKPKPRHVYVVGADFAHGLQTGDFDVAQVLDSSVRPYEQVAVAQGRWGETRFHKVLFAILRLYNDAFLLGERQGGGLAVMRTLLDEYAYTYMYYQKNLDLMHKPQSDRLGHASGENDIAMMDLRRVIRDNPTNPMLTVYDEATLTELEKMQWQARSAATQQKMLAGRARLPDRQLKMGAPPRLHDDLVRALALAHMGLGLVDQYESDKPKYAPGTMGYLADHAKFLEGAEEDTDPLDKALGIE